MGPNQSMRRRRALPLLSTMGEQDVPARVLTRRVLLSIPDQSTIPWRVPMAAATDDGTTLENPQRNEGQLEHKDLPSR